MGCVFAKSASREAINKIKTEEPTEKKFSWDNREKVNPKDYTIENLKAEVAYRKPGSVNGQQFIIQNCVDSVIYIFDHSNTVTIDDCSRCQIFLGPIKGSVFLRNCEDCKCIIACQQFRTRDCKKMDIFLLCTTQPIIESSTKMRFGCFKYNYSDLEDQFRCANLSEFNNNWSSIHDFTPMEGESNWSLIPEDEENSMPILNLEQFEELKISSNKDDSFVPQTTGLSNNAEDSCLVVFFSDGRAHERAKSFIQKLKEINPSLVLSSTKEVKLDPSDAKKVFLTDSYSNVVNRGPLIGLDYCGPDCIQACQNTAMNIATETGSTGLVYVSSSSKSASKQIDVFFNYFPKFQI